MSPHTPSNSAIRSPHVSDTADPGSSPGGRWRARRPLLITGGAAVVAAAVVTGSLLISGSSSDDSGKSDDAGNTTVEVSPSTCGTGWTHPHPGNQVFEMRNTSSSASEAYLIDAKSGAIFGEVEDLGPGVARQMRVTIGSGSYAFKCLPDDADAVTGPTVRVGGGGKSGPSSVAVDQHDLIPVALEYQKWIGRRMDDLVDKTDALQSAVHSGDLGRARDAWLTAHLVYERMGAAYGTFGDADGAINGTTAGLPDGVHSKDFTGFHRVEYGLWHGESAADLHGPVDQLAHDVKDLRDSWSTQRMDPADLGLRAHEILENAVQFELTGRTDYGSHSNLATTRANLDGTRTVLGYLQPLLKSRDKQLPELNSWLDRTQHTLDSFHHGDSWTPLDKLERGQRETVNADVNELVEQLAPIAVMFDVRRTV
jgi:iron uptake system component EfeO